MAIKITGIDWDTDGAEVDLPNEMVVDTVAEGIDDPENDLADWLSDKFGWTVNGVTFQEASEDDLVAAPTPR